MPDFTADQKVVRMSDPDAVLAAIDGALHDLTVGGDAMRWTPDQPKPLQDEATHLQIVMGPSRVFFAPVGTVEDSDAWQELEGVTMTDATFDVDPSGPSQWGGMVGGVSTFTYTAEFTANSRWFFWALTRHRRGCPPPMPWARGCHQRTKNRRGRKR